MRPDELVKWIDRLCGLYDDGTITLAELEQITVKVFDNVKC